MDITFSDDGSGNWNEIVRFSDAQSGEFSARPQDMLRRGETYHWMVTATDGVESQSKTFSVTLADFIGSKQTVISHSDCWKYGYLKHGREKGKWFATTQRGAWSAYDLDKGWYRTYQRLVRRQEWNGGPTFGDGGEFGHPFWGYWGGQYHMFGTRWRTADKLGYECVSSPTFEGFRNFTFEKDVRDTGLRTQQPEWTEGTTYTFSEDRAWIMAIDCTGPRDKSNVKYWEWTKADGWKAPAIIGTVSNHTGRVALVRHTRDLWYVFVTEGKCGELDGLHNADSQSTLKYFKSTDAGKTWGTLQDTGVPAHAIFSSVSFARYGDNYDVFLSVGNDTYICATQNLEKWSLEPTRYIRVAEGAYLKPHGTLLHPSALIFTVAADLGYHDDQYGIVVVVPEMISRAETPTNPTPSDGTTLPQGTGKTALSVQVHGPQTYDVAFYWEDGAYIGEDKLLREGDIATIQADGLQSGKEYRWYAVARGALLEYTGAEPDVTADEKRSEVSSFSNP
ncbi:MAG: hypothetical protein K1Y02_13545 [Candidatus Hydrogenedentes bacterium]|nr:hypothetical protein [Candidatus Hydrogenedentota bacterium]